MIFNDKRPKEHLAWWLTYLLNKLKRSIFLKFGVEETAVSNDDLANSILLKQERVRLFVLLCVFVPKVFKHNRLLSLGARVQVLERLVINAAQLFQRSPLVRGVLAHKDLAGVALTAQVDFLGVDLVWNVDEEHVEEVVAHVVGLENNFDFVGRVRRYRALLWNEHKWNLLAVVLDAADEAFQIEVDWEGRHVLNLKRLLSRLASNYISKRNETVFRRDLDFWAHASSLEKHRNHRVVGEHDDALLLNLLEQRFKLHHDRLGLAWLDRSHRVEN